MYKNWPEICKIGKEDRRIMMAIALVDLKSLIAERIQLAFPECFSKTEIQGPIPISVLREYAGQEGFEEDRNPYGHDHLVFYGATGKYKIPVFSFATKDAYSLEDSLTGSGAVSIIPDSQWLKLDTGQELEWEGAKYLIVDKDDQFLYIAPAECIDINS